MTDIEKQNKQKEYRKKYRLLHPRKVKEGQKKWKKENPDKVKALAKRHLLKKKKIVFDHYGRLCQCCGETEAGFLTIDHINNDGAKQRKEHKLTGGVNVYNWIINNDFPTDLRTLCYNCNFGKRHSKICPHEIQKEKLAKLQKE